MQEHGIEDYPGGWVQPEGNIGDAQDNVTAWEFLPNLTNRFYRCLTIASIFFNPRRDRKREGVKKDFVGRDTIVYRLAIGALCDRKFLLCRPRHPIFINRTNDDTRPVVLR